MSAFLDQYGVADAKREKKVKAAVVSLLALLVLGVCSYFFFRNWKEERVVKQFLEALRTKDYQTAYKAWGCTPEKSCRDYRMERFLEDWGPSSPHADISALKIAKTRSCDAVLIQTWEFGKGEAVNISVDRRDLTIGFAPWPVCNPRMQAP